MRGEPRQRDPGRGPFTLRCTNISILTPDILGSFCGKFSLFCGKFSVFSTPVHREAGVFCTAATVLFRPQQPGHRPRAAPRIRKKIMKIFVSGGRLVRKVVYFYCSTVSTAVLFLLQYRSTAVESRGGGRSVAPPPSCLAEAQAWVCGSLASGRSQRVEWDSRCHSQRVVVRVRAGESPSLSPGSLQLAGCAGPGRRAPLPL